ncbi:hypothetical protein BDV23DRAFT_150646 [Aspergillus alliaceus]|uniref:Uncharacterized protein n=1 Tax=Petromyces alliaceus TaxID=209559 RepID=A0A5N7CFE4_PETAA|nr:hypothetical protein BDV23DRAFT_150646 [Aspergillus alliaceus]
MRCFFTAPSERNRPSKMPSSLPFWWTIISMVTVTSSDSLLISYSISLIDSLIYLA